MSPFTNPIQEYGGNGLSTLAFNVGLSTGGRISELLSLRIKDVWQYSKPVNTVYFRKSQTKGKRHGRAAPIKTEAKTAIQELMQWYQEQG